MQSAAASEMAELGCRPFNLTEDLDKQISAACDCKVKQYAVVAGVGLPKRKQSAEHIRSDKVANRFTRQCELFARAATASAPIVWSCR